MEQCSLMATSEEQYVTIEIPQELIRHWRNDGYTHLHYGAIRLMLTLHGRRGLPVSSRVSLLDTSYLHYENAVIGTVLSTLHAGSVVLTLFPNYNVSLRDPTVPGRLKVQVQITGAAQTADAVCATLHYQIIYRLQTHAVNLALPSSNDGALFVLANQAEESPSIVQVPRNISREKLKELIPLQWVTNYENLHKNHGQPIQTDQATFRRSVDGRVTTIFQQPEKTSGSSSGPIFQTMMLTPFVKEKRIPIFAVHPDGKEIYTDRINGHFIWDVAPEICDPECDCWMHSGDTSDEEDHDSHKIQIIVHTYYTLVADIVRKVDSHYQPLLMMGS
uniref:Polyprotein n=1 Tax=Cajanus cajan TaxID=3821 RepID=A0A151RN86_CAJCA|nr:polyprotein [Cajanus cajan]